MIPIFESTYGIPIYQEQLMRAAVELAGYSPTDADDLRKAISKKIKDKLEKHRARFVKGAGEHDIDEMTANAIFSDWEEFARYGFNKSHAADYGVIAVQTAFLKAHYPAEFFTALLSVNKNDIAKVAFYIADSRSMGIEVLPPDVNCSGWDFAIEECEQGKTAIRFGLGAIKNVGLAPVDLIINARKDGPFRDLNDLARRVDLRSMGKRSLECLIKVGALDDFGSRTALLASMDRLTGISSTHFRSAQDGQLPLFGAATGVEDSITLPEMADIDRSELLNWERELLGLYVSEHPLTNLMPTLKQIVSHFSGQLAEVTDQEAVRVAGMVTNLRPYQTKTGKMMGFVTLEDIQGSIDLVIFPRTWTKYELILDVGSIVIVEGKLDASNVPPKILVDNIRTEIKLVTPADKILDPVAAVEKKGKTQVSIRSAEQSNQADIHIKPAGQASLVAEPVPADVDELPDDMPPPPDSFPPGWEDFQGQVPARAGSPAGSKPGSQNGTPEKKSNQAKVPPQSAPVVEIVVATENNSAPETRSAPQVLRQEQIVPPPAAKPVKLGRLLQVPEGKDHPPQMVTVTLKSTGDPVKDQRRIQRLHGTFISCPGRDRFSLLIKENGQSFLLEFPNDNTQVSAELLADLCRIVSETEIRIEPILYQ